MRTLAAIYEVLSSLLCFHLSSHFPCYIIRVCCSIAGCLVSFVLTSHRLLHQLRRRDGVCALAFYSGLGAVFAAVRPSLPSLVRLNEHRMMSPPTNEPFSHGILGTGVKGRRRRLLSESSARHLSPLLSSADGLSLYLPSERVLSHRQCEM